MLCPVGDCGKIVIFAFFAKFARIANFYGPPYCFVLCPVGDCGKIVIFAIFAKFANMFSFLPFLLLCAFLDISPSSCIQGNHFCSTVTLRGSRKTTAYSTSPWAATTEQKCVNWLVCSFSTDWPTNTGKKVLDSTGTTGSQFSRTPQDHKQNESGKTLLDTSRTTESRLLYRPT